jgi:hypothetical protein
MKTTPKIIKLLVLVWAVLCIPAFISIPGRASYIHWSTLSEWNLLPDRIGRIEPAAFLLNFLLSVLGITLFSAACILFGSLFIKAFQVHKKDDYTSSLSSWFALLGTAFLLGHGMFSLIFLTLASLYKLTPLYTGLVLITGSLAGIINGKKVFPSPFSLFKLAVGKFHNDKNNLLFLLFATSILIFSLFYASARQSYDATAIYFSDAKISALTNRAEYFTDDTFVASVLQSTIQYTAIIQVFGDQAARMFSWVCGLVIILFSLALAEKVGLSRSARFILILFLLSSTAFLDLMGDGKVDLVSTAPALATIYWMVSGEQNHTNNKSTLILVGCLAGLAIVARPFNLFLLGIFIFLYYIRNLFSSTKNKLIINSFLWIGLGAIGFGLFHLLANWIILGHPLAFLSSVSGINPSAGPWDSSPEKILSYRLLYPFAATFVNTPQSLGNITPLFAAFAPFLLIANIRKDVSIDRELRVLLFISAIMLVLWIFIFFTVLEIRYVMFLWIILFMPVAEITASALRSRDRPLSVVSNGLLFVFVSFLVLRTIYISIDTYSPLDKQGNPQCDKSRFCEYLRSINAMAMPGDRVLTLNAFRYYLRTDLFSCSTSHDEYQKLRSASIKSDLAFWEEVYRQGYHYIAYENDYTTRHLRLKVIPSPENTPEWIELEPIFGEPGDLQIAYKINISEHPSETRMNCQKNPSGIWEVNPLSP